MLYAQVNSEMHQRLQAELRVAGEAKWYRRLKVIDLSGQGVTVGELAQLFDLTPATVRSYIHAFNAAEVVVRGLSRMIPGLAAYAGNVGRPYVDGGYYCKTQENRPLIGPLPVDGTYIFGALSGYGIMASQAGADLLAAHIAGSELPTYAPAFALSRYDDPAYRALLEGWDPTTGQL